MSRMKKISAYIAIGAALVTSTFGGAVLHSIAKPTNSEIAKVRALGGIPACKHEDGSGQRGICWFDSRVRGNGKGDVIVLVPAKGEDDKRVVVLINR